MISYGQWALVSSYIINPCDADFISRNIIYHIFYHFLHMEMAQVVEIPAHGRQAIYMLLIHP